MKKWLIPAICTICVIVVAVFIPIDGSEGDYDSIGYTYNKFLFIPAKSANFTIRFRRAYSCELTLINEKSQPLKSKDFTIKVDGKTVGSSFKVNNKRTVNVSIRCSTNLPAGRKYIRVQGGGKFVTHVYFTHHMNPLLYFLSWILTAMAIACLVWFVVIRRCVYPQFKLVKKMFIIPGYAPIVVKASGVRMIVISEKLQKESFWGTLVKGPVQYYVHPAFKTPITLLPRKSGLLAKTDFSKYQVSPNPIPRIGASEIIDNINNLKITVQ